MRNEINKILRQIPSVDSLLQESSLERAIKDYGRGIVTRAIRKIIASLREEIKKYSANPKKEKDYFVKIGDLITREKIITKTYDELSKNIRLRRVVNATGVILHTGLGRAPLDKNIIESIAQIHSGYSLLEVDEKTNERIDRERYVRDILCELTGSEWAIVVNNNASATFLILNTFAKGKEVIVNRGELVEIGGQFRLPLILQSSGAILKEVGTTNRSYVEDYEEAITKDTALILKVHTSNYKMTGFVEHPEISELITLAKKHSIFFVYDIGSGAIFDFAHLGLPREPSVTECIKAGVDIFCFSGDKLLNGPQAGILLGKKTLLTKMRKNPLYRIMRVDKITLSLLEATLNKYFDEDSIKNLPIYKIIFLPENEIERRINLLKEKLKQIEGLEMELRDGYSEIGGGSLPDFKIKTKLLCAKIENQNANKVLERLRLNEPPIFAIAVENFIGFNTRTMVNPEEETEIIYRAFKKLYT